MKKRSLVLIVFLMLYITPVIFSTSSMSTGIVAEPFTLSNYGDISNQSVLSISNTLTPDVLFYPDVSTSDIYFGTSGDSDFEETFVKDAVYFTVLTGNKDIHYAFNETTPIEGFEYAIFGYEVTDDGTCKYYQYPGWTSLIAFTVTPSWYNGTVDLALPLHGTSNNYTLTLKFDAGVSANLYIDYVQIQFKYMTLKDSNNLGESFADVSDWNYATGNPDQDISTDGDIATIETSNDYTWDRYDWNTPDGTHNFLNYYYEVSFRTNVSATLKLSTYFMLGDDYADGANDILTIYNNGLASGEWTTFKGVIDCSSSLDPIESISFLVKSHTNIAIELDYFRVSYSNETGWQHDGSIINTVNSSTGDIVTTDGDQLHLQSNVGDDNSFEFDTTIQGALGCNYYPFLEIKTTGISEGDGWKLELFDGSDWIEITDGPYFGWMAYEYGLGTFRYNIESLADEVYIFRINTTATADIWIDYIWMNSIANFTLSSGSSNTVEDVLYCEDGELYSLTTEGSNRYWTLDYDIAISVPFAYNNYSLTVSANTQWFAEYIGGWEDWKVDEPSGILTKGTVTDFKILIDGTTKLSSILFIETLSWQSLDGVTFYFVIDSPYGAWTIQSLVIFLGLAMIPTSTIYLVHGGREEVSMDKVFYFLIMFIIGWALVIGGIIS